MDASELRVRAIGIWRLVAPTLEDLLRTSVAILAGLIVLVLLSYFPLAVTSATLAITFAGLAGLIHVVVAPARTSLRETWVVAVTASGALILFFDAGILLAGIVSGLSNSTTLDQSAETALELIGLIFVIGYLSGFVTELLYAHSAVPTERRGVLRAYKSLFAPTRVPAFGWRERGRHMIVSTLSFFESHHIGPLIAPTLLALSGVYSLLSEPRFAVQLTTLTGNPIRGLILWALLCYSVYPAGDFAGRFIGRITGEFARIRSYLGRMAFPAMGYMLGYVVLVMCFSGLFQWANQSRLCSSPCFNPAVPGTTLDPSDFFYLSLTTITTVGYGHTFVMAAAPLAKALVSIELLCGVFWTLIIFAALVGYLSAQVTDPGAGAASADGILDHAGIQALRRLIDETIGQRDQLGGSSGQKRTRRVLFELRAGSVGITVDVKPPVTFDAE